jgi:hypothetical protein
VERSVSQNQDGSGYSQSESAHPRGIFCYAITGANERSSREIIGSIAANPLEATGIQLSSRVMAIDEKARQIAVVTSVNLHQVLFQTVNGKFSGRIQAVLAQVDDRNAIVDADSKTLVFDVAPELFQPLLAKGGPIQRKSRWIREQFR